MVEDNQTEELTDEQAILKIAHAMKDNAPTQDEKQNVHTFLTNVIHVDEVIKVSKLGNLRDDKELNELGLPEYTLRGSLELSRISGLLMNNGFFEDYFNESAIETTASSLSREGFIIRQGTTQTKQVADITKRRKVNKGMFKSSTEQTGGDVSGAAASS